MDGDDGAARRDAALTLVVLVVVGGVAVLTRAPLTPTAVVVGAGATVAAELVLSRRAEWVRAVWGRRVVQLLAVVVAIVGGVGLALVVGPWVITALVAALLTYLVILAGSVAWRHRE